MIFIKKITIISYLRLLDKRPFVSHLALILTKYSFWNWFKLQWIKSALLELKFVSDFGERKINIVGLVQIAKQKLLD